MKKLLSRKRSWLILGILVVLVVIVGVGLNRAKKQTATAKKQYTTYQVKRDSALLLKGKVAAKETITVETGVSSTGTLSAINVKNGEHVEAGTVLMTFHDDQVQSQLTEANQTIAKTKLAIQNDQKAIATLKKAAAQPVATPADGETGSAASSDGAAADQLQQVQNTLAADQLTLQQSTDSLNQLNGKLNPEVTAKIAGTINIDTAITNNSGVPSMQIISDGQVIDGQVTEYDYLKLKPDMAVTVMPVSNADRFAGKIMTIDKTPQTATPTTGGQGGGSEVATYRFTVQMTTELTNGFNVQIRIPQETVRLPAKSLVKDGQDRYVYVVNQHKVHRQKVEVQKEDGYWRLLSGVTLKSRIIANPSQHLKEGQEVQTDVD